MSVTGTSMLNVYDFERIPAEDRLEVYADEMLLDARCSVVESAVVSFVTENIEPVGWRAVWRSSNSSTSGLKSRPQDFVVEVQDVSQCKLEATVQLVGHIDIFMKVLDTNNSEDVCSKDIVKTSNRPTDIEETTLLSINRTINVPLLELFPVYDESTEEQFTKTAEVIEHVRFFYKYLWFSWDEEDEDDCIFSKRYLKPRMRLYEDIKNGILSSQDVECYHSLLEESRQLHQKLESLATEMGASDSDSELNEIDVLACMDLRKRQDELKRKLLYMENPALRSLLMKTENSVKPSALGRRPDGEVVTHVVAKKFLAGMFKTLSSDTVIEQHTSFASAVAAAYDGDSIHIYEGVYACEALGWLDDSIAIEGKGSSPEDVVLEARGGGDIFLNFSAPYVSLSNLTVRNIGDRRYVIMVHGGQTVLDRCQVQFGDSLVGISVRPAAEITLKECRLGPAMGCCFDVQLSGKVLDFGIVFSDCMLHMAYQYDEGEREQIISDVGSVSGLRGIPASQGSPLTFSQSFNLWYSSDRDLHEVLAGICLLDNDDNIQDRDPSIILSLC